MERLKKPLIEMFKYLRGPYASSIFDLLSDQEQPMSEANIEFNSELIEQWYGVMDLLPSPTAHRPSTNYYNNTFNIDPHLFVLQRHNFVSNFQYLWKENRNSINALYAIYIKHTGYKKDFYRYLHWSNRVLTENIYNYPIQPEYKELMNFFDWCYKNHKKFIPHNLYDKDIQLKISIKKSIT